MGYSAMFYIFICKLDHLCMNSMNRRGSFQIHVFFPHYVINDAEKSTHLFSISNERIFILSFGDESNT